MSPFEEAIERLDEIPGVGLRTIEDVLAEIGVDMTRFPTSNHISSWAKICPGNNESGGKRKSGRSGKGNPWLKAALVQAAWAAVAQKGTYFCAQYHRLASRRGSKAGYIGSGPQSLGHHILHATQRHHLSGTGRQLLRRTAPSGYHPSGRPTYRALRLQGNPGGRLERYFRTNRWGISGTRET